MSIRNEGSVNQLKYGSALLIALFGLALVVILAFLLAWATAWSVTEITSLVGAFTTLVGTLTGTFIAVQAGTSDAESTLPEVSVAGEAGASQVIEDLLAALPPDQARELLAKVIDGQGSSPNASRAR